MVAFRKFIKSFDMFGHDVRLNFNNKGVTHTTLIGGFFSILIKLAIAFYVYINVRKLVFNDDDKIGMTVSNLNLTSEGVLDYDKTNVTIFWVMRKTKDFQRPFFFDKDEEVKKYFDLSVI